MDAVTARPRRGLLDRRWFVALVFFVLPAVVYAGLVSGGSFDPFAPTYGWQAYNWYAVSLADLRQSVPAEVIAYEGLYIDGRVYMYYGMLPAMLRVPLTPFVDLTRLPLSNLMVWGMLVAGQAALQLAALRVFRARPAGQRRWLDVALLGLVSFTIWFLSGAYLLIQNATFYHEPYAAALMLASLYVAMLVQDLIVAPAPPGARRLAVYGLLAALCVFTRPTFAVGLYIATLGLLLPDWRAGARAAFGSVVRRGSVALTIMLVAGLGFVAIGHARTGKYGAGWDVQRYGAFLIGRTQSRLETLIDKQFSAVRIVPNIVYVLAGGHDLRERWIARLGGGEVATYGRPIRHLLFMPFALLMAAAGAVCVARRVRAGPLGAPLLGVTAGLAATGLLQLAYATMMHRYAAELWPLIVWLMLVAMHDLRPTGVVRARAPLLAGLFVAVNLMSFAYIVMLRPWLTGHPSGRGSLVEPLPAELAALATAPGSRDRRVEPYREP